MDPDQTAPKGAVRLGFIVFPSMIKSSLKCSLIYAADVKRIFSAGEKNGRIRVKISL